VTPFAVNVTYAYGADPLDECAPRVVARGVDDAVSALACDLNGGDLDVVACAGVGPDVLLEARVVDGTLGALVRLDDDGAVARVLTFRTQAVEPPAPARDRAQDGRTILAAYFERLEAADFDGAAACFAPDVLYSHPPYAPGGPRAEYRGRDALAAGFAARGPRSWHHRVLRFAQNGDRCLVAGDVEGLGVWLSSFSLDPDGLVARYCSFYAAR
jgi:SnoaL-like domain